MSKKLNELGLQFYLVEFIVSAHKKTFVLQCVTYFDSNRTAKMYKEDRLVVVPYAERLERSLNSALGAFLCRALDYEDFSVKVRPLHSVHLDVEAGDYSDFVFLRPSAKIISTHLISVFIDKLYNLITDNNNNILNK